MSEEIDNNYTALAKSIALLDSDNKLVVFLILASFIGVIAGLIGALQCSMPIEYKHISYGLLTVISFIVFTGWIILFLKHIKYQEIRHYEDAEKTRTFQLKIQRIEIKKDSQQMDNDKEVQLAELEFKVQQQAKQANDELDID